MCKELNALFEINLIPCNTSLHVLPVIQRPGKRNHAGEFQEGFCEYRPELG